MSLVLGCIADDFTGATDLANTLVGQGMRTVQLIGVPDDKIEIGDAEAVVVALKTRTIDADDAVRQSLSALGWLKKRGARQIFFKYCSTFDSTDKGNIGPVADALLDALNTDFTIICPAFPTNGRTIRNGLLYVGKVLLSESSMKDHPLTPMRDANLVHLMERQSQHRVGLIPQSVVGKGAASIAAAAHMLRNAGFRYAVVDAVNDDDLFAIGEACRGLALVTGGSGVALGLPNNFRKAGLLGERVKPDLPRVAGRRAVIAGSCSAATRKQLAAVEKLWPSHRLDALALGRGSDETAKALDWFSKQDQATPAVIYSSAEPGEIAAIQQKLGREKGGALVEEALGAIAQGLVDGGVRQLIVAGGETSGAVVQALGLKALRIGPEIDPGIPWTATLTSGKAGPEKLALALKSGNFGAEDFFPKAFRMLSQ